MRLTIREKAQAFDQLLLLLQEGIGISIVTDNADIEQITRDIVSDLSTASDERRKEAIVLTVHAVVEGLAGMRFHELTMEGQRRVLHEITNKYHLLEFSSLQYSLEQPPK